MTPEELEKIVKANQLSLARIEEQLDKITRKLLWNRVAGILKIILILAPIILAYLYLTPLLRNTLGGSWDTLFSGLKIYSTNLDDLVAEPSSSTSQDAEKTKIDAANSLLKNICDPNLREVYVRNLCK